MHRPRPRPTRRRHQRSSPRSRPSPRSPPSPLALRWQETQLSKLRMPSSWCLARMFAGVCSWQPKQV
jgi:hypothetical protein